MTDEGDRPLSFSGTVVVQFQAFLQSLMQTDALENQVFVGVVRGMFGTPPNGTVFDARVKLTPGASFTDDAYEVSVQPALAQLGARPEFRAAAYRYVDRAMAVMVGPGWQRLTGLTGSNNVVQMPDDPVTIEFASGSDAW